MPIHLHEDHVGEGLNFSGGSLTNTEKFEGPIFAGRYLDNTASTNGTASFIVADTETNGAWTLTLRDTDQAAGMHYWINVDPGATNNLTISRDTTATINGNFAQQSFSSATSVTLLPADGLIRFRPDGGNWLIY